MRESEFYLEFPRRLLNNANKITTDNNFIYLTLVLLLLLFVSAIVEQYAQGVGQNLITASTVLMLIIGVFSIRGEQRWFHTGLGVVVAIVLIAIAGSTLEFAELEYLHLLVMLGAIGGMMTAGVVGLFIGSVVLALGCKLFMVWLDPENAEVEIANAGHTDSASK